MDHFSRRQVVKSDVTEKVLKRIHTRLTDIKQMILTVNEVQSGV